MRTVFTMSLLLLTIVSLGIGASLLIGRLQPPSERIQMLHLTDCAPPCWNGVTPGISSLGQVEDRIDVAFPRFKQLSSSSLPFQTWLMDDADNRASINVAIDDGVVSSMSIGADYPSEQMPTLGEALALFGAPTCVLIDDRSIYTTLGYENAAHQVILRFAVSQPALSNRVKSMSIGVSNTFTCADLSAMSWHDFRHSQYSFLFTS